MRSEKFKIKFSDKARCSLKIIPFEWQTRIENAIECLMQSPFYGRKMWKKFQDKRRLKLWPYRIVYEVDKKNHIIFILNIAQRGNMLMRWLQNYFAAKFLSFERDEEGKENVLSHSPAMVKDILSCPDKVAAKRQKLQQE